MSAEASRVLALVGSLSQLGSIALILVLVASMYPSRRHLPYFRHWGTVWPVLFVAIAAIVLRYARWPDGVSFDVFRLGDEAARTRVLIAVYAAGKLAYLALLVSGARLFVRRDANAVPPWKLVAGATLAGGVISILPLGIGEKMLLQSALAIPAYVACAALLLRLRPPRRSLGTVVLGLAFLAHAALWSAYAVALRLPEGTGGWLATLLRYNSFVDTVLQTLLAYGIVLVVTEEATLETKQAHLELEKAHEALRHAAFRDQMSGVMNRHAFDEGVGLERLRERGGAVAVLDVDHLKPLNDSLGHAAGDALLLHVATVLSGALDASDALYRWGGDEFLVVLADCDEERARRRLDGALGASPTLPVGGIVIPVRASFGCAAFASRTDLLDAIASADAAMYAAKSARRVSRETPVVGVTALRIDTPVESRAL